MRAISALLLLLLLVFTHAYAENQSKPRIVPFFDRIDDGPAFFVDCRNTSGTKVSSAASIWPNWGTRTLRMDGSLIIDTGNSLGPGLTTDIEPGQSWRGIIVLRQTEGRYFPAVKFGALRRITRVQPLTAGRHTIAVQCDGIWSDDFEFYWDDEAK
jgi:hypothetical protein